MGVYARCEITQSKIHGSAECPELRKSHCDLDVVYHACLKPTFLCWWIARYVCHVRHGGQAVLPYSGFKEIASAEL